MSISMNTTNATNNYLVLCTKHNDSIAVELHILLQDYTVPDTDKQPQVDRVLRTG